MYSMSSGVNLVSSSLLMPSRCSLRSGFVNALNANRDTPLDDLRLELVRGAAVVEVDVCVRPRDENQLEVHGDVGFRESALNLPAPRSREWAEPRQHIAAELLLTDCWGVPNVVNAALDGLPLCEAVRLLEPAVEYTDDFLCVNRFHVAPPFHPPS